MRAALAALLLAACATTPVQGDRPGRSEMEGALVASLLCEESQINVCHNQPRRASLSRLSCVAAGDADHSGRILCRYAGRMSWLDGRRGPIASDCAYLTRNAAGVWRVESYPDAEMCAF